MYTVDDRNNDIYEDEYYSDSNWDNRKGLIFKIIIIVLCIIVLVWLIKALKNSNNLSDNGAIHSANVEKVRLAAEDYFFIKNNKSVTSYVTLSNLKSNGLINDIIDANNKVCSDSGTVVNINKQDGVYRMLVKLSCSTNDKEEVFYYHSNTLACLNCTGKTNMLGNTVVVNNNVEKVDYTPSDNYSYYSCVDWTSWSKDRIYDSLLTERAKTVVQGVKYGNKTIYSDWSEYTTTPIVAGEGIEVETKTVVENTWGENKTGTNIDTNNQNIRVVSSYVVNKLSDDCKNGYIIDNVCYSNKVTVGNLTIKEYNSNKYDLEKPSCEGVKTLLNEDGVYTLTYVNCRYNETVSKELTNNSYTVYTYQELEPKEVTYYRYRTIRTVSEPNEYTTYKYEEKNLPNGFVKVNGTEETYYSYKLTTCEK